MSSISSPPPLHPDDTPPETPKGTNRLPVWTVVVLGILLLMHLMEVLPIHLPSPHGPKRMSQQMSTGIEEDTMTAMITTTSEAKSSFISNLTEKSSVVKPAVKDLKSALKTAEKLQVLSHNMPSSARRLMLLRDLLNKPMLTPGTTGLKPLDAFGSALPSTLSTKEKASYAAEARLWRQIANREKLTPHQTVAAVAQLRAIPAIGWWIDPALMSLYKSQGDLSEANRYAEQARTRALATIAPLGLITLFYLALGLLGVIFLIYMGVRTYTIRTAKPSPMAAWEPQPQPQADPINPWPLEPERVAPAARKLTVGDLMGVFVVYMVFPELLGLALSGYGGYGPHHISRFGGLISPLRAALVSATPERREVIYVMIMAAGYLLSALVAIGVLVVLARRRGASLANEIGWTRRHFGRNILYGALGYGVALPLVILVGKAGPHIFKNAPSPENPAIPLLANASSHWTQVLLVLLAVVAAPITEEILFRGVFFNAAKMRYGAWPAIIMTGFIFGFVHPVGLSGMLPLMVLGGVFAWMAETRKSLAPSMVAHFMQNFVATVLVILTVS